MPSFSSRIAIIGANPYITPPPAILRAIFKQANKSTSPIPVRGTLKRSTAPTKPTPFQQTLMRYQGAWRLYLNGPMRDAVGAQVGDRVRVEIAFDAHPRTWVAPAAFTRALTLPSSRRAKAAFSALSPSRQKEITRYLGFAKTEATLTKNIKMLLVIWVVVATGSRRGGLAAVLRVEKRLAFSLLFPLIRCLIIPRR